MWGEAKLDPVDPNRGLIDHLAQRHDIAVEIAPIEAMQGAVRRFDAKARRLVLSEVLPRGSRNFHIAYQIGLIEAKPPIDAIWPTRSCRRARPRRCAASASPTISPAPC